MKRRLVVAGVSVVAGAALTVAALFLAGWRYVPVHRYEIQVQFEVGATAEQTAAVRAALENVPGGQGVVVESREERFEDFKARWAAANDGEPVPDSVTAADLPELMSVRTTGRDFDCPGIVVPLRERPGVRSVGVGRTHGSSGQSATVGCM